MLKPSSYSFLGLNDSENRYEDSKFIIVPVPYDSTVSYRSGSRDGPYRVIEASHYLESFDLELESESHLKGIFTVQEVDPVRGSSEETVRKIHEVTEVIVQDGKIPILIGGEHTITLGAVRAMPENTTVVVLDAHADLRDTYLGDSVCHACGMRRVLEEGKQIVEIGVRSMSTEEFLYAKEMKVPIFYSEEIRERGIKWLLEQLRTLIQEKKVYLSVDVDVFDPSEAPGVSTPEPGGLSFWEVREIIKNVCQSVEVVGVDVVEVTPIPGNNITEFLAAKTLYKIIGYV